MSFPHSLRSICVQLKAKNYSTFCSRTLSLVTAVCPDQGSPGPSRAGAGDMAKQSFSLRCEVQQGLPLAQLAFPVQPARSFLFLPSSSGKQWLQTSTQRARGFPPGPSLGPGLCQPTLGGQEELGVEGGRDCRRFLGGPLGPPLLHHLPAPQGLNPLSLHPPQPTTCHS